MNKHWIEKIKISKKQVEAIIIPENCNWNDVPKIDEMKSQGIESIVLNVADFAEMFATISKPMKGE